MTQHVFHGLKRDHHDTRDYKFALRASALHSVERMALGKSKIEDQGQLGSCTGNSSTSGIEIVMGWFSEAEQRSRLQAYYNGRVREHTTHQDAGAEIRDVIKGLVKTGVATEKTWPYDISKFAHRPSSAAYREAHAMRDEVAKAGVVYERVPDLDGLLHALNLGAPVVFGFTVYDSFESNAVAKSGIVPMPGASESVLGGHAVTAVGCDMAEEFVWFQNSWTPKWGVGGYGKMPFKYFTDPRGLVADLWAIRKTVAA